MQLFFMIKSHSKKIGYLKSQIISNVGKQPILPVHLPQKSLKALLISGRMSRRQLLLISSSTVHNYEFLEYAKEDINNFLQKNNVSTILFIPYALKNHDAYLDKVSGTLKTWGYRVDGIHKSRTPREAIQKAQAVFIGGGNTFLLLKNLYEHNLVEVIRHRVLFEGMPYMGASAGTNVATLGIHTTNDMPIVYPPSFKALGLVPFNINPHYMDPPLISQHQGETRQDRILQYLDVVDNSWCVLGLREGTTLLVNDEKVVLKGLERVKARLFMKGKDPKEVKVGTDLSFLLKDHC